MYSVQRIMYNVTGESDSNSHYYTDKSPFRHRKTYACRYPVQQSRYHLVS